MIMQWYAMSIFIHWTLKVIVITNEWVVFAHRQSFIRYENTSTVISTMNMNQNTQPNLTNIIGEGVYTTSHSPLSSFMKSKYAQSPFQFMQQHPKMKLQ